MSKALGLTDLISTPSNLIESAIEEQKAMLDEFKMKNLEIALNQRGFHFKSKDAFVEFIKTHLRIVMDNCANGVTINYIYLGYVDLLNPGTKIMTIMNESAFDITNWKVSMKTTINIHQ